MNLSIIIVNYRTPKLVLDCLRTVYAETRDILFEVIVVDNASGDNSRDRITAVFPAVRWIQMDDNAGFARANNAGIRESRGASVLLLNSDTLIENEAVSKCLDLFTHSAYPACGVQLLNVDRTPQISGNFFTKGGLNHLLPLPYLGDMVKWGGGLFKVSKPNVPDSDGPVEVDWINGAFLMVKQEAIAKAGLMDEDFFLYAEEAEWCGRLRKLGKLCLFGQCKIVHLQGASANETFGSSGQGYYNLYDRKGLQIMLSNFVRIRKQFGTAWYLVQLFFYILEIPVFLAGLLVARIYSSLGGGKMRYSFFQWRKYSVNIFILLSLTLTIIRNRPHFYKVL